MLRAIVTILLVFCLPSFILNVSAPSNISELNINGLKVVLERTEGEVVAVNLFLKGGVRNINASNQGIEYLLFQAAKRGSESYPPDLLNSELRRMGTTIGVGVGKDFTIVSLRCLKRYFDTSFDIFTDVLLHPTLNEREVEIVRKDLIRRAKQERDLPGLHVHNIAGELFFEGHPYLLKPQGIESSLAHISASDLAVYREENLVTSKLLMVVVGNVTPSDIEGKVEGSWGKLPRGKWSPTPLPSIKNRPGVKVVEENIPTNYILGFYSTPDLCHEDYYPMLLACDVLSHRLDEKIRAQSSLAYTTYCEMYSLSPNYGVLYLVTPQPPESVSIMFQEIQRLKEERIDEETLKDVAAVYITKHYLSDETAASQAQNLALYELEGRGWEDYLTFEQRIKRVTPDDILRVTQKYLRNFSFGVLGMPDELSSEEAVYNGILLHL
jgi:zinc protease